MKLRLDIKTVAALPLGKGQSETFAWDTELPGFGLRLQGRRRTYVAQYRAHGRTRRVTLGTTERLTPMQAREGARKILARVSLGDDPQAEKAAKRVEAERTFRKVVDVYLAAKQPTLRPSSFRIATLYLANGPYFRPLHAMGINEITHPDIAARLSSITRNHSAHTAAAARRQISSLFRWAMEEGWVQANPVVGTRKPADPKPRDRVLSDAELVAIWNACGDDDYGRIVQLLILLGARRSEIGGMRWSELDLTAGTWALPAERSKNHRAHTITLPPPALAIVRAASDLRFASLTRQQLPFGNRGHLFGVRAGSGFAAWDHGRATLDRRLVGAVKPWRLHDLRRSVATKMADIGIEPHVIEAALNHFSGHRRGVAGVYNRSPYERAVKAALARWSERVLALVEGRKSNVVAFHA
jgi:integrase